MNEALTAETITHHRTRRRRDRGLPAPGRSAPITFGSVVVIHHMPGYDSATKEIARKFAAHGYAALMPNLYYREAPGASPDDAAATARAKGGVPDERLVGDVGGAADYLRALDGSNGKVGVIGYCSGGRQSFLAACSLAARRRGRLLRRVRRQRAAGGHAAEGASRSSSMAEDLSCPLLGLFGADDKFPTPEETAELSQDPGRTGQGARVPHLRRRRARVLLGRPARPTGSRRPTTAGSRIWDFYGRYLAS